MAKAKTPVKAKSDENLSLENLSLGGNSSTTLRSCLQRIEKLEEEKDGLTGDIREIYIEAKSAGFDPKVLRIVVRRRKLSREAREELDSLVDTYESAVG